MVSLILNSSSNLYRATAITNPTTNTPKATTITLVPAVNAAVTILPVSNIVLTVI
jgi:hypothetical protein